jgi:hypothetical protein
VKSSPVGPVEIPILTSSLASSSSASSSSASAPSSSSGQVDLSLPEDPRLLRERQRLEVLLVELQNDPSF